MENPNIRPESFRAMSPEPTIPAPATPLQPQSLSKYRLSQGETISSVKLPSAPTVRKPGKAEWFRTYPDGAAWESFYIFADEEDSSRTCYIVAQDIAMLLGPVVSPTVLIPCISLSRAIFFWPQKVSDRTNSWSESARRMVLDAKHEWRRCAANMAAKSYDAWRPEIAVADPEWPDRDSLSQMLIAAFSGRVIDTEDHPMVRALLMK